MKRLWATIDRWGPGAISVLTLLAVIVLSWNYDRQLAARNATIIGLQRQIDILNTQVTKCSQNTDTSNNLVINQRFRQIEDRTAKSESDILALDAWMRNTRERLAEKGWKP